MNLDQTQLCSMSDGVITASALTIVGQPGKIQVNTFLYTRYVRLHSIVDMLSHDVITDQESNRDITDSSRSAMSELIRSAITATTATEVL